MRVIFFGTPDFAVPTLQALHESGETVALVVTQPDRLKGRGHKLSAPPVKEYALAHGIPVSQPVRIRTDDFAAELAGYSPDAIVVVAYGRIIPPAILTLPRLGCINVHGSLLPKYRGAAPIQRAIINGEKETGITTMLMDEGLDTGDMLLRESMTIGDDDTTASLSKRLAAMGASMLMKTLAGLSAGSVRPSPQTGEPTYAAPLRKEEGNIDWSLPADVIRNLVRGTHPWPGAFCRLNSEKVTILRAAVEPGTAAAGEVVRITPDGIAVGTGKGLLVLHEVKPEGRATMSAAAFASGRHLKVGARFESA